MCEVDKKIQKKVNDAFLCMKFIEGNKREQLFFVTELALFLDACRSCLSDRELIVIRMKIEERTYTEIGDVIGVTGNRVQQIYNDALIKLKAESKTKGFVWGDFSNGYA